MKPMAITDASIRAQESLNQLLNREIDAMRLATATGWNYWQILDDWAWSVGVTA